jgi:hypothetical protein
VTLNRRGFLVGAVTLMLPGQALSDTAELEDADPR